MRAALSTRACSLLAKPLWTLLVCKMTQSALANAGSVCLLDICCCSVVKMVYGGSFVSQGGRTRHFCLSPFLRGSDILSGSTSLPDNVLTTSISCFDGIRSDLCENVPAVVLAARCMNVSSHIPRPRAVCASLDSATTSSGSCS